MIDPIVSLAFTLKANPGVYAILLGSGVSRSAGIPTGWEVVLDLVRRAAVADLTSAEPDPEAWYREKFGEAPDYSALLDRLCRTPAERQQLLRGYFEPTEDERDEGAKGPTAAHHAVAAMMASGHVRIVVTTNFDRLLEQALEKLGVVPVVISNADQAAGMLPLVHQRHCIIKVHGDYLDPRIMNTADELASYTPQMDALLDRVFDEFGLIACGWSGQWDPALRAAIERAPSRRFSCYWAAKGSPTKEAASLLERRRGIVIETSGADTFFSSLNERLRALEELDQPHPLTVSASIAALKRYLVEDRYRIRLHDLCVSAVADAKAGWPQTTSRVGVPVPSDDTIPEQVKLYDAANQICVAIAVTGSLWARNEHFDLFQLMLSKIGERDRDQESHYTVWQELARYPAALFFYACGIGAILNSNPQLLGRLMTTVLRYKYDSEAPAYRQLHATMITDGNNVQCLFTPKSRRYIPLNNWIEGVLLNIFVENGFSKEQFELAYDTFEFYLALANTEGSTSSRGWVPVGAWGYRHENADKIVAALGGQSTSVAGLDFALEVGCLGKTAEKISENVKAILAFRAQLQWY